jgi:RimJ/RimL family protein N-acetyltransferase
MFITELSTANPHVRLIKPDAHRDAPLSVAWLAGSEGRNTLKLMGVADHHNHTTSLDQETQRLRDFLETPNQYNWMISLDDHVIGSIWVDRRPTPHLQAPAVSIMLGDPAARGRGVGRTAMQAVIDFLHAENHHHIHSRHLTTNTASRSLLQTLHFQPDGLPYTDADGLHWQNLILAS